MTVAMTALAPKQAEHRPRPAVLPSEALFGGQDALLLLSAYLIASLQPTSTFAKCRTDRRKSTSSPSKFNSRA